MKLIENTFEKDGPFDGIMGFSQGACFLGLLCSLQQRGRKKILKDDCFSVFNVFFLVVKAKFNFAIMSSGFQSYCTPHRSYYDNRIDLPSLHIYGETDAVIPTGYAS